MRRKLRREQETFEEREARLAADRGRMQWKPGEQQGARLAQLRSNQAECLAAAIRTKTGHIGYVAYHVSKMLHSILIWLQGPTHIPQSIKSL